MVLEVLKRCCTAETLAFSSSIWHKYGKFSGEISSVARLVKSKGESLIARVEIYPIFAGRLSVNARDAARVPPDIKLIMTIIFL